MPPKEIYDAFPTSFSLPQLNAHNHWMQKGRYDS